MSTKAISSYVSKADLTVLCRNTALTDDSSLKLLAKSVDHQPGGIFISNYEFPNRYTRWDIGFKNPPLMLEGRGRSFTLKALNPKGRFLLHWIGDHLNPLPPWLSSFEIEEDEIQGKIKTFKGFTTEGRRTYKPTIISLVRFLRDLFASPESDGVFGWYGAFGYDLVFQVEDLQTKQNRYTERDLVLYLPDEILVADRIKNTYQRYLYEFVVTREVWGEDETGTINMGKSSIKHDRKPFSTDENSNLIIDGYTCDNPPKGEYAQRVQALKEKFRTGEMFECVLSQQFCKQYCKSPSILFNQLLEANPSPYSFFLNLSGGEFLVGASPEMFVRVTGSRVESCPISGTIARGDNPLEDSARMTQLLTSEKDECELVMCTDIDRNDKSRICHPGSVQVLAHRQIETYSKLFHTVDHVEGQLRPQFDSLDAFESHLWAVTVTGAPKKRAMEYIEQHETSPRRWYGGAVGMVYMNGDLNTGLTLRTIHLEGGYAKIRAGATLLYDSCPADEEAETHLKASALTNLLDKLSEKPSITAELESIFLPVNSLWKKQPGLGHHVLIIDFEDSFVHTIASYFEELGAKTTCIRHYYIDSYLDTQDFSLVVFSPGPRKPSDYPMTRLIARFLKERKTILGICLGHQALIEYFGGELNILPEPVHGKSTDITIHHPNQLFKGIGATLRVGRYHSLYSSTSTETFPDTFCVTAESGGIVMAFSHKQLPVHGIQFHLESILSNKKDALRILSNLIEVVRPTV